jgi:hypothetical protein
VDRRINKAFVYVTFLRRRLLSLDIVVFANLLCSPVVRLMLYAVKLL